VSAQVDAASTDAEPITCVVCHRPIRGRVPRLGGRPYCAEHYAKATIGSRGNIAASAALLSGLVLLALVMLLVGERISDALNEPALVVVGLVLAVVPAVLWLLVFRQQDRLEPEPHQYLLSVLLLAALFTGTVGEPIRRGVFALHRWQADSALTSIIVHALSQGVIQALIVYVTVRYTVFLSDEFDERADGIIYGTAAGLGTATLLNFNYVLDHRGLQLDVGTARIIVAALVLAALGGLVGYGLGQVKFERHGPFYAASFVALAALLNGVFDWLQRVVTIRGLGYSAWPAVLVAALYAAVVVGVMLILLRRAVKETLALADRSTPAVSEA
jgi:RsiW-degrading membrane proteinase PrsW (M82 family)